MHGTLKSKRKKKSTVKCSCSNLEDILSTKSLQVEFKSDLLPFTAYETIKELPICLSQCQVDRFSISPVIKV